MKHEWNIFAGIKRLYPKGSNKFEILSKQRSYSGIWLSTVPMCYHKELWNNWPNKVTSSVMAPGRNPNAISSTMLEWQGSSERRVLNPEAPFIILKQARVPREGSLEQHFRGPGGQIWTQWLHLWNFQLHPSSIPSLHLLEFYSSQEPGQIWILIQSNNLCDPSHKWWVPQNSSWAWVKQKHHAINSIECEYVKAVNISSENFK